MEIKLEIPLSFTLILLQLMPGSQIRLCSNIFHGFEYSFKLVVDAAHIQGRVKFGDCINIRLAKSTADGKIMKENRTFNMPRLCV